MFLDRTALLTQDGLRRETVALVSLGGAEVRMRQLSAGEYLDCSKDFADADKADADGAAQMRVSLGMVARSLCNEDDTDMFPNHAEHADVIDGLLRKASAVVQELIRECLRIQGLGKDALKVAVGNSGEIPNASSL